jgi:AcrR family transcriptional regulator
MSRSEPRTRNAERSRTAILDAAAELFAAKGFERTTVREIGLKADVDPALVIRYFGSKDALFAEVAVFDLNLPELTNVDPAKIGETLVAHFLHMWEDPDGNPGLPVLYRSAASNAHAAAKLRELFATQVAPMVSRAGDPATANLRAGLVASQILGLAFCRYVLRLPPVVDMTVPSIIREVGQTIQHYATNAGSFEAGEAKSATAKK